MNRNRIEITNLVHVLKITPQYFEAVRAGVKNFEIRKNDRNFKPFDFVELREWDGAEFTGRRLSRRIAYTLHAESFPEGLQPGYVVLGLD